MRSLRYRVHVVETSSRIADELDELKQRVIAMARLAQERLSVAVRGLVDCDRPLLDAVVAGDAAINDLHIEIDDRCVKLLARHQPVAVDLRTATSALRINNDLERVGDLAVSIGKAARRYVVHPPVKPLIDLPRMGTLALKMLGEAIDAFMATDVVPARLVLQQEAWLDAFRDQIFRELLTYMISRPETIEPAIQLILISRHLERVGDHATNIAEDVIFIVEARDIRHRSLTPAVERRRGSNLPPV